MSARLNEVQLPKELQRYRDCLFISCRSCLNEVQFPKELQLLHARFTCSSVDASMKCSSRRNCNLYVEFIYTGCGEPQ